MFVTLTVIISWVITAIILAFGNIFGINNMLTTEIFAGFPVVLVPHYYSISIWATILFGQLVVIILYLVKIKENRRFLLWFTLTLISSSVWTLAFHFNELELAVAGIFFALWTQIRSYRQLINDFAHLKMEVIEFIRAPLSINLAWISLLATGTIGSFFAKIMGELPLISPEVLCSLFIVSTFLVGVWMLDMHKDIVFAMTLVVTFCYAGTGSSTMPLLSFTAWSAAGILGILLITKSSLLSVNLD